MVRIEYRLKNRSLTLDVHYELGLIDMQKKSITIPATQTMHGQLAFVI